MDEILLNKQMLKYEFGLKTLENSLSMILKEYTYKTNYNPVEHIKSRIKTIESATNKLVKRGYPVDVENLVNHVHDMIGFRIVCSFLSDVELIVSLIKKSKQFKIIKEKDYISNPKNSGYISYHMRVLVPIYIDDKVELIEAEIQIRTMAMDFWASLDHKMRYKYDNKISDEVLNGIYNCSLDIQEIDRKMQELNDLMNKI